MTSAELNALLAPYGISPVRDRGQHFLLDEGVVAKMVDAAEVREGDEVLEIGPGPGILTAALLDRGASVTAVELDVRLEKLLQERFAGRRLRLILGDARAIDTASLPQPYKLVANLPYNITSAVLEKFLLAERKPVSMTVMVQKEVAERIAAKPGEMGSLSVLCQALAETRKVANVPKHVFFPPPKVESAVVHLRLRSADELAALFPGTTWEKALKLSRSAFAHPRKQLKNTLLAVADAARLEKAFAAAGIAAAARPETLTVADWGRLAAALG
jgi:16S rRNA (adenine1518-N6/adenine1519-N6)-dimethyltransferase